MEFYFFQPLHIPITLEDALFFNRHPHLLLAGVTGNEFSAPSCSLGIDSTNKKLDSI